MLALTGATIFPTPADEPIRNGTILIDGSTIAAVGSDLSIPKHAEVMDCAGCTVMAGFWNCHVHFFERKWADARAIPASELAAQIADLSFRYGFTTLFDIGSMWDNTQALRERIESGEVLGPRIYTTGEAVLPLNGRPDEAVLRVMGVTNFPAPEVSSAAEAVAAVRALLNKGVDAIKLFASSRGTTLDQDVIEAAVVQAHRAGKPVFIHPNDGADVARALRAGVDVIAHTTPSSGRWEEELLEKAAERRAALTPTLMLWQTFLRHDRQSAQAATIDTAIGQLRAWRRAGCEVLFGTDLGAVDYDPKTEYIMMERAGMSFEDILASLTTGPTRRFSDPDRFGKVAAGFEADLAVTKGDPRANVAKLTDILYTIRGGKVIFKKGE